MVRSVTALILASLLLAGPAWSDGGLSEGEARRLMEETRTVKAQLEAQQRQMTQLRELLLKAQQHEVVLREELARRGVDVELLLAPPATQADPGPPVLIFESPESMGEYLRENFTQRVRQDMTQLQREAARRDFDGWLTTAALLPTQVTWVFRVVDVWRATTPERVGLSYFSDRQPLVSRLTTMTRSLDELEMMELSLARLKAEQRACKDRHDQRVREFATAQPATRQLAERLMKQAYDRWIEINAQVRTAEARYLARRNAIRPHGAASQPEHAAYCIMMHARGARDDTIELNIFCHERDANLLMAAHKGALVKVRGWICDVAMAERLATLGYRIDHAEVLAVNVDSPPPPAAIPTLPTPSPAPPPGPVEPAPAPSTRPAPAPGG